MSFISEARTIGGAVSGNQSIRKVPVWKGDHRSCSEGHRDGVCHSLQAWRLDGSYKVVPVIVGRSVERRHQVIAEYSEESGREQEPGWLAKGFRSPTEAEGTRPSEQVFSKIREYGAESAERELQHRKAAYQDQVRGKSEFFERFDAANKAPSPKGKAARSDG